MQENEIKEMIKTALPDAHIKITDLKGDGDHYAAEVTSVQFIGKTRVQQHKMVYNALTGMGDILHALALKTIIPKE